MSITELQSLIQQELQKLGFDKKPEGLYEPASYILNLGGKRLRPALVLMACGLFDDPGKAINQALAVEVFHNFTLMHDDIMDEAPLRRGERTVHEKWNINTAILSGDVMLVKAYQLLANCDPSILPDVLKAFNKMAIEVCEGQQMDMDFETRDEVSEEEYIHMIQLKTSVLLGCAMEIGALVGGASTSDAKHLYQFGLLMGTSFQIKDDLLDCFGKPESVGKQVGGDILANKKTLLLIHALNEATNDVATELNKWLNESSFDAAEKVTAVKAIYNELNIESFASERMDHFYQAAIKKLDAVSISPKQKKPLYMFAEWLMNRES